MKDDDDDFESHWQALGRPGPIQKAIKKAPEITKKCSYRVRKRFQQLASVAAENMEKLLAVVVLLVVLAGLGALAVVSFRASGQITFCYIEKNTGDNMGVTLKGHVDWRADKNITSAGTLDEAISAAKKLDCPLHK